MTVTEIAIKRPSLVVVLFIILSFVGFISYNQLSYELLPKFSSPFLSITAIYPGASPSEVENSVTKKIEDAVSQIENVKTIRSQSLENFTFVGVELTEDANIDFSLQDAQRKVNAIADKLPEDCKTPVVSKFSLDDLPIIRMAVFSNMQSTEFYQFVKNKIQPAFSKIPGVAQINLIGGEEREIKVNVNPDKLNLYNLGINQVVSAISASNLDFPTGNVSNNDKQVIVRLAGKFTSIEQLKDLVVYTSSDGSKIKMSDIAEVLDSKKEIHNINRLNKKEAIGIQIQKQSDANAVSVTNLVEKEIKKIEEQYKSQNVKFDIAQKSSEYTLSAADAVIHDLMIAILLVAIVMFLFLHSIRNSFIVMVAIPASMISVFTVMYLLNYSLNLMTLLALSLVVGILVDDSIVVLENIYRHLEMGKDKKEAAIAGRNEIGFTALSITLVDVVVFLPLTLLSGLVANILRQFSVVVVVSTLMSLFVSFTVTPLLASRLSKIEHPNPDSLLGKFSLMIEDFLHSLNQLYGRIIKWSLAHKIVVLVITSLLFAGSIALAAMGFIGSEFVSKGDRGEFIVVMELDKSATFEANNQATIQAENILLAMPEVKKVFSNVGGSSEVFTSARGVDNKTELTVILKPKEERKPTEEMIKIVRAKLSQIPGVKITPTEVAIFGGANQAPIQIIISGSNPEVVSKAAHTVMAKAKEIPGTVDTKLTVEDGNPEVNVIPDKEKLAVLGLNLAQVGATLQTAFTGNSDIKYRAGDEEYDINVMFDQFDRTSVEDVSNIKFINNRGEQVKLSQFATITRNIGYTKLERRDRVFAIGVHSHVVGRPMGTVGNQLRDSIKVMQADKRIDPSLTFNYDGDMKNNDDSQGSMGIALLASILFVYLIMVALYDNYIYPFVVLFSIPLAIVGALFALAMSLSTISIFTMLGIIMLIGLVAKNAILLVDFTNHLKTTGLSSHDALVEAGKERLRPILMTTIAMVIGFLPIALATGAGSEWKNGLAWALIGGLTSSLFLTLVVVPIVYFMVDSFKSWILVKRGKPGMNVR